MLLARSNVDTAAWQHLGNLGSSLWNAKVKGLDELQIHRLGGGENQELFYIKE